MSKTMIVIVIAIGIFSGSALAEKKTPNQKAEYDISILSGMQACIDRLPHTYRSTFKPNMNYYKSKVSAHKHTFTKDQLRKKYEEQYTYWTKPERGLGLSMFCNRMREIIEETRPAHRAKTSNPFN